MDELFAIGGKNRPNAVLRRAATQRTGLVQDVVDDDDGGSNDRPGTTSATQRDERDDTEKQSVRPAAPPTGPTCFVCRLRSSPYTCPQCNIAYCSLSCFRAEKHAACASTFAQRTLRDEVGVVDDDDNRTDARQTSKTKRPLADEAERQKMLDVLRRLQRMNAAGSDNDDDNDAQDEEDNTEEVSDEWEDDSHAKAQRAGVDLDTATTNELLALLSVEERERFQEMIRGHGTTAHNGASLPRPALAKLISQSRSKDDQAVGWWRSEKIPNAKEDGIEFVPTASTKSFQDAVKKLRQTIKVEQAPVKLEWNVVALILAYVYVVRHLDVQSLQDADADEQTAARETLTRLTPYLVVPNGVHHSAGVESNEDMSRTLLTSAEEATIWIVARLEQDAGNEPAATMRFLHEETLCILRQTTSKVTIVGDANDDDDGARHALQQRMDQRAFHDVYSILPGKAAQRKLVFYAAYWLCLLDTRQRYDHVISALQAELTRLEAETKRTEDEERWRAAHEMVQQQGSVVLPL